MDFTKRKVITGIGATGLTGLIGTHWWKPDYQFEESGQLRTSDSILAGSSIDPNSNQPHYAHLVNSQSTAKQIKWEYLSEEDPVFTEMFRGINFDAHFFAVSGIYLPRNRKIGTTETTFEEGVMRQTHEIRPAQQKSDKPLIHNVAERWELNGHTPPETIEINLSYQDEPIGNGISR